MARAFPDRAECPDVPDNDEITGKLVDDGTDVEDAPPPVFEFPFFDVPPPDIPPIGFGCYAPELDIEVDEGREPLVTAEVKFPKLDETGVCEPVLDLDFEIPPCVSLTAEGTGSVTSEVSEVEVTIDTERDPEDPCTWNLDFNIKIPDFEVETCFARAASASNISTLSGEQTIDGVALTDGEIVLVKNQSAGEENGTYTVRTGAWERTCTLQPGILISVRAGTVNSGSVWQLTTEDPIILGVTSLTFVPIVANTSTGGDCCCTTRAATVEEVTLSGEQTIDGVALAVDDTVLVKNQTSGEENGPYRVTAGAWERICTITAGHVVSVREGNTNRKTLWMLTNNGDIEVEVTALVYEIVRAPGNSYADTVTAAEITLSGIQDINGVTGVDGLRVLVKDQTTASANGLYLMRSTAWERTEDPVVTGMVVAVKFGGGAGSVYVLETGEPITVGSSSLSFVIRESANVFVARVATVGSIALSGTPTIDGVNTAEGDKILAKDNGANSGVYEIPVGAGAWDIVSGSNEEGALVAIREGDANKRTWFVAINSTPDFEGMGAWFL